MLAMIDSGAEERLEKLIKMLSSDKDGEVVAAARAINRTLNGAGTDIHELAARVKGGGKLSDVEMQKIFDAGVEAGKNDAAVDKGFDSVDGTKSWHEMALYCAEHINSSRLYPNEPKFIEDMVRWTERREPSEKQGAWLHRIYVRLGRR
jgi:hypothetical protein